MAHKGAKVFVAMSGGVDSSTAAALLLELGYNCAGVFMITSDASGAVQTDAQRIADKLGIKLHTLELRREFEGILEYFCGEYKKGRTPNPCVFCNRHIKFGKVWDFARANGAEFFATGHYAKILRNADEAGLYETANLTKDQSYVLAMIERNVLSHLILPMGDYSKSQTRKLSEKFGLGLEQKEESQEICFIPNDDYVAVLEKMCPELVREGNIVDSSGKILGHHSGVHRFTIGQRRGLKVAMGRPWYVTKLDAASNTVVLGPKEEVMHNTLIAKDVNWLIDKPAAEFTTKVKVRYNSRGSSARVLPRGDEIEIKFDEAVSAITPGQLAVFYIQDNIGFRVAGGGWIDSVSP